MELDLPPRRERNPRPSLDMDGNSVYSMLMRPEFVTETQLFEDNRVVRDDGFVIESEIKVA